MSGPTLTADHFRALFEPKGIIVAGASTHPGKFGFVSLHNVFAGGYQGKVFATNLQGEEVLGVQTVPSILDIPEGEADVVFVCTPAKTNIQLLRDAKSIGVSAAFLTSAGYGEAGEEGRRAQEELIAEAERLGMLVAGPNGQGFWSASASLCAQIVAPVPPKGRIGVASQSGNFVSSFQNYAVQTGVGISRSVSAGNAACVSVPDFLEFYADDPETAVGLAYIEGVEDGRGLAETLRSISERKPVVVVKGGATAGGQKAAASHTGSLASDDRVFDGMARQAGVVRAPDIEGAFEAAATFASQPLPKGNRVVVLTTVGGWGVAAADAITRSSLELAELPQDLFDSVDALLPPRWSKNNPIDMAGGETRDTIPEIMRLVAAHPDVDAVLYLGIGIQSNTAALLRAGGFYPDHGLERMAGFHESQDARYAQTAYEVSVEFDKPVLIATELAVTHPDNPGPATVRSQGRLAYPSANRAVAALDHLWQYAKWRADRGR